MREQEETSEKQDTSGQERNFLEEGRVYTPYLRGRCPDCGWVCTCTYYGPIEPDEEGEQAHE